MKNIRIKLFVISLISIILFSFFRYLQSYGALPLTNSTTSHYKYDILTKKERLWLENEGTLIYSADRNAPPLRFVDGSDHQYKGVVIDYLNSMSLEMGFEIKLHPDLWENALKNVAQGNAHICDMFKSEERAKYFLFSKPIYNLRAVIAVNSRDDMSKTIENLNTLKIATQKDDYVNEFLTKSYPNAELVHVADINEALKLLLDGTVNAVAGDEPVVLYQIDKNNLKNSIKIYDRPLYENEVVFAVPKSKPDLIPILNKGIDTLNNKGQLEKIQQKWFGISAPIVKPYDVSKLKKLILICFLIGSIILFTLVVWNQSLKKKVKLRTKELEDSHNNLQTIFNGMTSFMIVIDKNKKILNTNNSFLEFIGRSKNEILNNPCSLYLNSLCKNCDNCPIISSLNSENYFSDEVYFKNEAYEIKTYPLKDTNGIISNILIVINNITSEKISKNQLLQANKMIAIGELAAGVAHEIRNPLGIIRNHSYILRTKYIEDTVIKKSLDYIDSSIDRASKIISNLLNFSRISGNSKEVINIKDFITSITELERKNLEKNNICCNINCNKDLVCYINQESLKHILMNLISNAIDAIKPNGIITINSQGTDGGLTIECSDTGCGIDKSNLEQIFNPFYTTKDPGKGTGLGLYIVYNEVKKQNGEISVESEVNKGTTFKIFIPIDMEVNGNE